MSRPFILFYCSNVPFFAMLFLAILVLLLTITKLCAVILNLNVDFNFLLRFIFEPILIISIVGTTVISLFVYVLFWFELKGRDDIDEKIKKEWRKKFLSMGVLVNSLYYEFKYKKSEKVFFLEEFIVNSRDKIIGRR